MAAKAGGCGCRFEACGCCVREKCAAMVEMERRRAVARAVGAPAMIEAAEAAMAAHVRMAA